MTALREAAQQALEALEEYQSKGAPFLACDGAVDDLRAALAQQEEPVAWMFTDREGTEFFEQREDWDGWWTPLYTAPPKRQPQTIDEAMRLPRAMAQTYENGYKAGVAHEREACAQVCEARFMGDLTREDMEARRCAAAIRARGEQP